MTNISKIASFALSAIFLVAGCSISPFKFGTEPSAATPERQLQLARAVHDELLDRYGAYEDDAVQGYVQRIGEQIAALSDEPDLIFRFTVLDTGEVNAFSTMAGYVYITRGLLAYLNSEAQLAAALAHEIGHVALGHAEDRLSTKRESTQLLAFGSVFIPDIENPEAKQLLRVLGDALVNGYGEAAESEAYQSGAEFLARAGYDSAVIWEFYDAMKNVKEHSANNTHVAGELSLPYHAAPLSDAILSKLKLRLGGVGPPVPRTSRIVDQEHFYEVLEGLTFGHSRRRSLIRDGIFYDVQDLVAFKVPRDWRIDYHSERITAYASDHRAYLQLVTQEASGRTTPQQFIERRLGINKPRDAYNLDNDGIRGYSVVTEVDSPFGVRPVRFTVFIAGARAFIFVAVAESDAAYATIERELQEAVTSFHTVTAEQLGPVEPLKLHMTEIKSDTTLEQLAKGSALGDDAVGQLRLLNQLYPTGDAVIGRFVKLVE